MIKVTNTRQYNNLLVTDAELLLVECRPEEGLLYIPNWKHEESKLLLVLTKDVSIADAVYKAFKPILISRTEKIEVGVWYFNDATDSIEVCEYKNKQLLCSSPELLPVYKVLALPEHFSPEQLQMIVDGRLKEGKCLVECLSKYVGREYVDEQDAYGYDVFEKQIKLNPHITIYPVEEKRYTREDVKKIVHFTASRFGSMHITEELINNWFERNIK